MYSTLTQNIESVALGLLTDTSNPITAGRGSFVRSDYDEREGFNNIQAPFIILFDVTDSIDTVNDKDTWTCSVGFYELTSPDATGPQTDAILARMHILLKDFIKNYKAIRADVSAARAERDIKAMQGTLTGWALTFTTTTRQSC